MVIAPTVQSENPARANINEIVRGTRPIDISHDARRTALVDALTNCVPTGAPDYTSKNSRRESFSVLNLALNHVAIGDISETEYAKGCVIAENVSIPRDEGDDWQIAALVNDSAGARLLKGQMRLSIEVDSGATTSFGRTLEAGKLKRYQDALAEYLEKKTDVGLWM